jgi:hypothetical protein
MPGLPDWPGRWEMLRALGAVTLGPPGEMGNAFAALGLPGWTAAGHTLLFTLALPPHASVYLGPEGRLGGEAADRVAGTWRALGLSAPADADHLGMILALYAELGEAGAAASGAATRDRLDRAREAVLWEHLWSWLPGYLLAVTAEAAALPGAGADAARDAGAGRTWARLARRALVAEARASAPARAMPLALREAPAPLGEAALPGDILDVIVAPVRAGFILTRSDIALAAQRLGLGLRRGERRFALAALLEQDPRQTLGWLAGQAGSWSARIRYQAVGTDQCVGWWSVRAAHTARLLRRAAGSCGASSAGAPPGRAGGEHAQGLDQEIDLGMGVVHGQ